MLMTTKTATKQVTCPLTIGTGRKPSPCIGSKCAAFTLYVTPGAYKEWIYNTDGLPLGYCGKSKKPPLEQALIQFPHLFSDGRPIRSDSIKERHERARHEREGGF